jgi:hypothetical protein
MKKAQYGFTSESMREDIFEATGQKTGKRGDNVCERTMKGEAVGMNGATR